MSQSREKKPADLFSPVHEANLRKAQPLAARMRPRDLDEFVGQEHFLGPGKLLRRLLLADRLGSLLFYGPPGSGKTALAHVIAHHTHCRFVPLNATATTTLLTQENRDVPIARPDRWLHCFAGKCSSIPHWRGLNSIHLWGHLPQGRVFRLARAADVYPLGQRWGLALVCNHHLAARKGGTSFRRTTAKSI
jgi:hypothetical protein